MRPYGSPTTLEKRRRRAISLLEHGLSLHEVARRIGCHASSVMRWRNIHERYGKHGLNPKPVPGRPPRLSSRQKAQLVGLLTEGAMANGYRTELWTTARIAKLIERTFHVRYHRDHVGRLMHALGWSYQKPERRALQRDEEAIEEWKRKKWPQIKKKAKRLGAHLVFVDESGFLLIPPVRKTWAPRGRTPIHRHHQRRTRISVISGVSVSPKRKRVGLYFQLHDKNIHQAQVCEFLRHLLRHLRGHVIVLWDNGSFHKGEPIRELCSRFARLHLERFPAYAPELNPDEGVWASLKNTLANGRPDTLEELWSHLLEAIEDLATSQRCLRGCIYESDLPPFLP